MFAVILQSSPLFIMMNGYPKKRFVWPGKGLYQADASILPQEKKVQFEASLPPIASQLDEEIAPVAPKWKVKMSSWGCLPLA